MGSLVGMLWRQHASPGRLAAVGTVGVVVVLLGLAILVGDGGARAAQRLVDEAGFALLVPVTAAVFATSVLGDPAEDGTLGHLLTTPRPRWRLAVPALAATTSVVLPLAVLPLVVVLALNGVVVGTIVAVAVASALVAATYSTVFVALGLGVRRALLVGLLYIALWEGVVARFGTGLARLSVRQYALSLLAALQDDPAPSGGVSGPVAAVVLVGLVVAGTIVTTLLLRTHRSRA